MILKDLCVFLAGLRRQEFEPYPHRYHVNVQVKNDLSACGLTELLKNDAFGIEGLYRCLGDLLRGARNLRQIICRDVEDTASRYFRNDQCVSR